MTSYKAKNEERSLSIKTILDVIPHRYPFILIDHVLEIEPGKHCKGLKNVTRNEEFFQGHFPMHPVMPGVLILESMAQACCMVGIERQSDELVAFASMDNVKFRHPVTPGDQLLLDATLLKSKLGIFSFKAKAEVRRPNGAIHTAATAEFKFAVLQYTSDQEEV